jgi:HK97 family phage prohead protease
MMQFKNILADNILDVDTEKKTVKAVWANIGNVDLDNDVINLGAFTKTINERGPKGKNLIWSLIDHDASLKSAIGKPSELYVDGTQLIAITKLVDNEVGEDVLALYNEGLINQHSIGFSIPKGRSEIKENVRYINEVMLYEGSAVLWGANPETPTLGMFKNIAKPTPENANERLEKLCKLLKHGKLTDETFSLIEIEIKQIQSEIATYVVETTPKPTNDKSLLEAIKFFNYLNP